MHCSSDDIAGGNPWMGITVPTRGTGFPQGPAARRSPARRVLPTPIHGGLDFGATPRSLSEIPGMPESRFGLHPLGETAIMRTAVSCDGLGPSGFEVKRAIGRGRRGAPATRSVAHARQRTSSM